jgi:hypothetical protein
MTTRHFAQDTKVPVGQSQSEVKAMLRKHAADQIAIFESSERSVVAFQVHACMYRVTVPINPKARNTPQEERRAWRLLGQIIRFKLEAVREGATTIEREFLADMVLYDGQTMSEWATPQLEDMCEKGHMPRTLMLEGPQ